MSAYVYMLTCADDTIYTGWTTDVAHRLATHNQGKGAKYTRARLPVTLAFSEECIDRSDAQKREYVLRNLPREEKKKIIAAYAKAHKIKESL